MASSASVRASCAAWAVFSCAVPINRSAFADLASMGSLAQAWAGGALLSAPCSAVLTYVGHSLIGRLASTCVELKIYGAFVLHAIDATPARWR